MSRFQVNRTTVIKLLALAALAIPPVCMVWLACTKGILYTFSEGECWWTPFQAANMLAGDPRQTCLLTDQGAAPFSGVGEDVYTHNPWMLPRLACLALLVAGVDNVIWQNLIICLLAYGAYVVCVTRLLTLKTFTAICLLLFLHLDYFGFFRPAF